MRAKAMLCTFCSSSRHLHEIGSSSCAAAALGMLWLNLTTLEVQGGKVTIMPPWPHAHNHARQACSCRAQQGEHKVPARLGQ